MFGITDRIGKFYISHKLISEHPEWVKKIMSKVIVLRCECLYHMLSFEYIAYSDQFEPVPEGCEALTYEIEIENEFVSFNKL